jgi:hypothetical protein
MLEQRLESPSTTWIIACPKCDAPLSLHRTRAPAIDESGFETYRLYCAACGAALAGLVDPYDDELLLTEVGG